MSPIRRHLTAIGIAWLVFQASVLAVSPFVSCCAAQANAVEDDKCCEGLAPGQMCPLHKHRHAPPKDTPHDGAQGHHDGAQSDCAIRGDCARIDPALMSLGFGLGVLEPPVALTV
ncbi:MAG TPA: hypothetical protein VKC35_02470, partial [Vicinamibacterales bacterium]|nr:hypothetical protein [Vicinamibacterales bacterium]